MADSNSCTDPYGFCLVIGKLKGWMRQWISGWYGSDRTVWDTPLLKSEEFQASTNDYKIPQNVVAVCDLLPGNVHALVSNRLMPYIRLYDPSITLEFGRNALAYNGIENRQEIRSFMQKHRRKRLMYRHWLHWQKEGCTFLVFSNSRTYSDDWEAYGYKEYGHTDEFTIFVDTDYEEGQNTKKMGRVKQLKPFVKVYVGLILAFFLSPWHWYFAFGFMDPG